MSSGISLVNVLDEQTQNISDSINTISSQINNIGSTVNDTAQQSTPSCEPLLYCKLGTIETTAVI